MSGINILHQHNSISTQRENILTLNPDRVFGVYDVLMHDEFSQKLKLSLVENVLCTYEDTFKKLEGPKNNPDMTIISLNALRKGEIKILSGKTVSIKKPILLSNGVIDYVRGKNGKKHIITSLRDGGIFDSLLRTTTAGRNIGSDLEEEILREHIEECPFLGKDSDGNYTLATVSTEEKDLEILIHALTNFIKNKSNLKRENPEDKTFIDAFERNFPGIRYEELPIILSDIIKNKRFKKYLLSDGNIDGLDYEMLEIEIACNGKTQSSGKYLTHFDKQNHTFEYRKVSEIIGFEDGFHLLSKRPSRLFLESTNQYPRLPRIEQAHITQTLVPTIEHVSKKVHYTLNKKNISLVSGVITSKYPHMNQVIDYIREDIEKYEGKAIVFDIDGVLIEAGLEVGNKKDLSVEKYTQENTYSVEKMKKNLIELQQKGYQIILCTGRGDDFATKVGNLILGGNYDTIISEGGVLIKKKSETPQVSEGLEDNSRYIALIKTTLIKYVEGLSGSFEEGKEYVLSFNPPEHTPIMMFKEKIIKFLAETFPGFDRFLMITNSQTAVDILPLGADKMTALHQVLGKKYFIYFGDSNNDLPALKEAHLGIIPANGKEDFHRRVTNFGNITYKTVGSEIKGVVEGLKLVKII